MNETVISRHGTLFVGAAKLVRHATKTIFVRWPQRRRQRLQLLELTEERLRDIGIEPHQARQEASRPFWD